MPKISGLNEITDPAPDDILAGVDDSADTTKYVKIGTLFSYFYPVGSQYVNYTDDTSPATLFGVGTWERVQGRTVVGISDSDPDFAEGVDGGQKDIMRHKHEVRLGVADDFNVPRNLRELVWTDNNMGDHVFQTAETGTGVNNMNPYTTAYVWKRTA